MESFIIKGLQYDMHVDKIHTKSNAFMLELNDKRIATCSTDKSISIVSLDYENKKSKRKMLMTVGFIVFVN